MRTPILSIALLFVVSTPHVQAGEDVEAIVKALFPKQEQMQHQRLGKVAENLGLRPGAFVAEVGCGEGEAALVWSRVVGPTGHVWAEDIDPKAVKASRRLMRDHHAKNVTVQLGSVDDPHLPAGSLDGISLFFVYHELVKYPEMLARFHAALKPDGRLVIIDPMPNKTASRPREVQCKNHVLLPGLAEGELKRAGFEVITRDDHFVDDPDSEGVRWLIVAKPVPTR